jgi:hypothetical protein
MLEKTWEAFDKAMEAFDKVMDMFDKEIDKVFRTSSKNLDGAIKIKIGKGSTVNINGASAKTLNDVTVLTKDPDTLMCKTPK